MATPLTRPVARGVVFGRSPLPMTVSLTKDGITFREFGRRTAFVLPYGVAYQRAAQLAADQRIQAKRSRRVSRGLLATEKGR